MKSKPTKEELKKLAEQIRKDQTKSNPAEKRVKLNLSFKEAIKKMLRTPPSKKKDE